jgi:hypothetical protein
MGQEDYKELSSFLRHFVRRLKMLKGAEGFCLIGVSLLLLFSLGLGIEEIKTFFPYAPAVYSGLTVVLLALLIGWTLYQGCRRISQEGAALYIEKQCPHLKNNLINSLQLYPQVAEEKPSQEISTSMILALLRATRSQLRTLQVNQLINTQRLKTELRLLGLLFVPVLAVVLFNPSSVGKTFSLLTHPLKDLPPSQTFIEVAPKGTRVARGSEVTIRAATSGAIPKSLDLIVWPESQPGAPPEKLPMEEMGEGKFSARVEAQKSLRYRVATGPFTSPSYSIEAIDLPEIANLKVTLYPPYYTKLPTLTLQGGNIDGLKGSTLRLEASSTKEVVKAKLLLDEGREIPFKIDGKKLQGNLVLFQSQRYRIQAEDPFGFRNAPISYNIQVRPDGFPTVELLKPVEDLEVHGDETLPLEFSARDDFGIQEVALVIKIGDRQEKLPIQREEIKKLIVRERFNWDLGKLGLREGDEATVHLEVLDNDTISGPKIGSSRALRLRLKNLKAEHKQVAEMVRDLSGQMIDLLGDHLEKNLSAENESFPEGETSNPFEKNLEKMAERIDEIMQRTEKDRLSDFATWADLEALKRNLRFTKEELLQKEKQALSAEEKAQAHDEIASELERMSILSEEISKRLKAQELASTAQDIMKSQERLLDSLESLKSGDKNLDAVLQEISRLANLLGSLQQALSQFASRLPEEFMNSEAMRGLGFNDMFSALEQIRKKLMEGDIEGAMQLARELFNQLASMVASLQNANQSAMSSSIGRMQGEMMRSAGELQQIAREQQEILTETEAGNQEKMQEREALLKDKLDQFQAKAQRELGYLAGLFPDRDGGEAGEEGPRGASFDETTLHHLIKNMLTELLQKDLSGFEEIMQMAEQELKKPRSGEHYEKVLEAEEGLKDLKSDLSAILQEPLPPLTEEQIKRLRDLSYRQGVLKERTDELHEKLNALFQLFPSLDPKITQNIQEAGTSMGEAHDRLGDLDGKEAVPPERQALELLSQSQQQMQNSLQQLAQRGQLGHLPVTFLFRRGRFLPSGQLVPLPGMPNFPQFDVAGGMTGLDMEKFQIPGKEDYKAPSSFREEVLDSLKQEVPPELKDQIESYFKNLSE